MKKKRRFWEFPWGYKESFTIAFSVLFLGFMIEAGTGNKGIVLPHWPYNLIVIIAFIAYIILSYRMVKTPFMKWLSSVPAAISAISVMTFLILLMGFIRQNDPDADGFIQSIGLTHVTRSWPYFLISLYLLIILGYSTVRRSWPLSIKNFAFFLNHGGLWILVVAASLGTADLWRLNMTLQENARVSRAFNNKGDSYKMPFALELIDFHIKEYVPNVGLVDKAQRKFVIDNETMLVEAEEGETAIFKNWEISFDKFLESARRDSTGYQSSQVKGSAPAVFLTARNLQTGETKTGWTTSGSYWMPAKYLDLSPRFAMAMSVPRPKEYSSDLRYISESGETEEFTIKVNQPKTIHGWTIYQTGYNEEKGKWSEISIVEIVRDPWLPVIYIGIFMILLGSLYLVWVGRTKNKNTENELD